MRDFAFAQPSKTAIPGHKRSTYVIAAVIHVLLIALLIQIRTHPTRVSSAGSPYGSMTAYVAGSPAAGAPATSPARPVEPKKPSLMKATRAIPQDTQAGGSGAIGVAGGQGSGPVRLGSGGNLTLVKRVQPIYPPLMQSARMAGMVILDAVINPDGTIGDITVLRATNDAFAQSAIAAVKQWQYSALGFQGILTVNVNFTLPS